MLWTAYFCTLARLQDGRCIMFIRNYLPHHNGVKIFRIRISILIWLYFHEIFSKLSKSKITKILKCNFIFGILRKICVSFLWVISDKNKIILRILDSFWSILNHLRVQDSTGWELSLDTWLYIRDSRWMSYEPAAILNQNHAYIPHIIG